MQLTINYEWPVVKMKASDLFSKTNANGRKITTSNPKVHSFISHLHNSGVTEKSMICSEVIVTLPQKIQSEEDSWNMEKVIVSDTKMIILEFSAFQKSLLINDADISLDF